MGDPLPNIASDPAPSNKMSFGLDLWVEDWLHSVVVEAVRFAEVHDREAVGQVGPHVLYLKQSQTQS